MSLNGSRQQSLLLIVVIADALLLAPHFVLRYHLLNQVRNHLLRLHRSVGLLRLLPAPQGRQRELLESRDVLLSTLPVLLRLLDGLLDDRPGIDVVEHFLSGSVYFLGVPDEPVGCFESFVVICVEGEEVDDGPAVAICRDLHVPELAQRHHEQRVVVVGKLDELPECAQPQEVHVLAELREYFCEVGGVVDLQLSLAVGHLLDDEQAVHAQAVQPLAGSGKVELLAAAVADELGPQLADGLLALTDQLLEGLWEGLALLDEVDLVGEAVHLVLVLLLGTVEALAVQRPDEGIAVAQRLALRHEGLTEALLQPRDLGCEGRRCRPLPVHAHQFISIIPIPAVTIHFIHEDRCHRGPAGSCGCSPGRVLDQTAREPVLHVVHAVSGGKVPVRKNRVSRRLRVQVLLEVRTAQHLPSSQTLDRKDHSLLKAKAGPQTGRFSAADLPLTEEIGIRHASTVLLRGRLLPAVPLTWCVKLCALPETVDGHLRREGFLVDQRDEADRGHRQGLLEAQTAAAVIS